MERKKHSKKFTLLMSALILATSLARYGAYIGVKQIEYYNTIKHEDKYKLYKENDKFVQLVKRTKMKSVTLTSVGNSIGFGFSLRQINIPLLLRDEEIIDELEKEDIECTINNAARMENNDDEKTFELLTSDVKLSDIYKIARQEYVKSRGLVRAGLITKEDIEKYFPTNVSNDKTLGEIALDPDNNNMNVMIYNGCTGSFLDDFTRDKSISSMLNAFNGFSRDMSYIRSFCEYIYLNNPHTQIYLCGVPNFCNLDITDGINEGLKEIANSYPNVTYVESIVVNVFQEKGMDSHPNTEEYRRLLVNALDSICENYVSNEICSSLDTSLKKLNIDIDLYHPELRNNEDIIKTVVEGVFANYDYASHDEIKEAINKFLKIFKSNKNYDYSYISEDMLKDILKEYTLENTSDISYSLDDRPNEKVYKFSFYQRPDKIVV